MKFGIKKMFNTVHRVRQVSIASGKQNPSQLANWSFHLFSSCQSGHLTLTVSHLSLLTSILQWLPCESFFLWHSQQNFAHLTAQEDTFLHCGGPEKSAISSDSFSLRLADSMPTIHEKQHLQQMETTTAFNLHVQVAAMVLNKGKHRCFTLNTKMCLLDNWPLSCLSTHAAHDFCFPSEPSRFLEARQSSLGSTQGVLPGPTAQTHDSHSSQMRDLRYPSALGSKHAIHSFILWGLLAISIPLLRLVEAAGRWSKSLSVSYSKHSTSFLSGESCTAAQAGPFQTCRAVVLLVPFQYQDKVSNTHNFGVNTVKIWILDEVTTLWIRSLQALWYSLDVPIPIGN